MVANLAGGNYDNSFEMGCGFLEAISDPVFIIDYKASIIYINRKASRLYGYDQREMIGQNLFNFKGISFKDKFFTCVNELKDNCQIEYVDRSRRKDGSVMFVSIHASTLTIDNEEMIICILKDISTCDYQEDQWDMNLTNSVGQFKQIVNSLTTITEVRDPYTASHQKRVANLACAVAQELDFDFTRTTGLYIAGLLHDIGKIYVPNEILTKPGSINEYEFSIIKKHSEVGYDILNKIRFPWPVSEFVVQHHERMNGTGYPFKLDGDSIYLESMVLAVSDVVESISSHRPYRPALGVDFALEEIINGRGRLFNKDVVDACLRVFINKEFDFDKNPVSQLEEALFLK